MLRNKIGVIVFQSNFGFGHLVDGVVADGRLFSYSGHLGATTLQIKILRYVSVFNFSARTQKE